MSNKILNFSKGKKRQTKSLKPTTDVLTANAPKPVTRCRVCQNKYEKCPEIQVLVAGKDKPQLLPLMICPTCGHTFVGTVVLEQIKKAVETPI